MRCLYFFTALAMLIAADSRGEDADSRLIVESEAAIAKISLRSSSRPVRLPNLSFNLRIQALCPGTLEAKSISISIADTRVNIRPNDGGPVEKTIRVPRKQLGPIAVNDFCIAGDSANDEELLQLHDALTAQLSLHCVGENQESMLYETIALEVALQCDVPENAQAL
jgi:hypothetical protein